MSEAEADGPGICPICRSEDDFRVPTFTWWGGAIGHRIISHVYCNQCNSGFNSKTGKNNTMNIILYQVGVTVILLPVFGILFFLLFSL